MDLTFRTAPPVFAVVLTLVYLVLLLASKKLEKDNGGSGNRWSQRLAIVVTFILATSGVVVILIAQQLRATVAYSLLASMTTASLLCTLWLYRKSKTLPAPILVCALIYYVMVLWVSPPSTGFVMGERSSKLVALSEARHWGPSWGLVDAAYDPFPMNIGMPLMASLATSIPYYAYELFVLMYLPFVLGYALTIYVLAETVTHSWLVGILAVVLLGATPPISILHHEAQWIGNLLVLVSTIALIKLTETKTMGSSHIVIINLCYAAAILMHTSAAIAIFIPLSIFSVDYVLNKYSRDNGRGIPSKKMTFLITFFVTFFVITFGRMIYSAGYLEYFLPYIVNFVTEVYGFVEPGTHPSGEPYSPLYERAGVSPIYAYAWATSLAIATAFMIYLVVRKKIFKENPSIPALYTAAATFVLVGYIAGAVFETPLSPSFWRGMYVALPLILPGAAAAAASILRSRGVLAFVLIVLLAVGVGIAVDDPMISTYRYHEIREGTEALDANTVDVWEANQVDRILPKVSVTPWISSIRFQSVLAGVRLSRGNLESVQITALPEGDAISMFFENNTAAEAYVLPQEVLSELTNLTTNLVFSGPRDVILTHD